MPYLFLILIVIPLGNLWNIPNTSKPVLIVDCGKNQGVFQDSCFKMIQFATNRLANSGRFENVRSISNHSFLYRNKNQVFTITLSDNSSFRSNSMRNYLLSQYQSELSVLSDKNFRYAVVYTTSIPQENNLCPFCMEISDTLSYSKLKSWFYFNKDFNDISFTNLGVNSIRIQLDFIKSLPVNDVGSFYRLNTLQNKIYSVNGVKTVYSAINIYSFIGSAIFTNPSQMTPETRWQSVIKAWELGGERRSAYIDFVNNSFFMEIFFSGSPEIPVDNIKKILTGYSTDVVANWIIVDKQEQILAKKDDTVKKENKVALDEKPAEPNTVRK